MIKIYDTTLRDGTQSPEVNFSVRDKLEIAKALDEFGADYIELGWPGSNPKDREVFLEAAKLKLNKACVVAFGATRRKNISASEDENLKAIIQSKAKAACIFGKTWLEHVEKQLKAKPEDNLEAIKDSIKFLKENGIWDEISMINFMGFQSKVLKGQLDEIKNMVDVIKDYRLSLSRRKDVGEE